MVGMAAAGQAAQASPAVSTTSDAAASQRSTCPSVGARNAPPTPSPVGAQEAASRPPTA